MIFIYKGSATSAVNLRFRTGKIVFYWFVLFRAIYFFYWSFLDGRTGLLNLIIWLLRVRNIFFYYIKSKITVSTRKNRSKQYVQVGHLVRLLAALVGQLRGSAMAYKKRLHAMYFPATTTIVAFQHTTVEIFVSSLLRNLLITCTLIMSIITISKHLNILTGFCSFNMRPECPTQDPFSPKVLGSFLISQTDNWTISVAKMFRLLVFGSVLTFGKNYPCYTLAFIAFASCPQFYTIGANGYCYRVTVPSIHCYQAYFSICVEHKLLRKPLSAVLKMVVI